jgi:alpha-galactosidase
MRILTACVALLLVITSLRADDAPIQAYLLIGQSNMEGYGRIVADPSRNEGRGSLEHLTRQAQPGSPYARLRLPDGQWITRDDVHITFLDRNGPLTVGYGARPEFTGPEFAFGHTMGDHVAAPVLLIKCAWGGKSLGVDFRPPSRGPLPYSLGEKQDAALKADPDQLGRYYRETLRLTRAALADHARLVPGSGTRRIRLAGIAWHQGWNDRINDQFNAEYEENLVHLIRDLRKDLDQPGLPFAIAETGQGGPEEKHPRALSLMRAQAQAAARPEFKGNVAFVPTREYWRPADQSPANQSYHWNQNAETYYLIGESLAKALIELE